MLYLLVLVPVGVGHDPQLTPLSYIDYTNH